MSITVLFAHLKMKQLRKTKKFSIFFFFYFYWFDYLARIQKHAWNEKLLEPTRELLTWAPKSYQPIETWQLLKKRWVSFHYLHKPNFGLKSRLNSPAKLQISIKPMILSAICLFLFLPNSILVIASKPILQSQQQTHNRI